MIIFPAIDIQNGECVRLTKGDFATAERVAEDPVQTALAFREAGAEWLHMVDLDGAKTAQMQNREVFIRVAKETGMKIELGGGIREMKTAEYYLENGIERIILGSIAVKNPKLLAEMVRVYGDRIVVGIDADNGLVKIEGWQDSGRVNFITLAREMEYIGVQHVIYTDISRDGTLTGPNLADLRLLRDSVEMNVIASGGISNLGDIVALNNLKLYGAICGKSLYHGSLELKDAIAAGQAEPEYDPTPIRPAPRPEDSRKSSSRGGSGRQGASSRRADTSRGETPAKENQTKPGKQNSSRANTSKSQQAKGNASSAKAANSGEASKKQAGTGGSKNAPRNGQRPPRQNQRKPSDGENRPAQPAQGQAANTAKPGKGEGNKGKGGKPRYGRPYRRKPSGNRPKDAEKTHTGGNQTGGNE